MGSEVNFRAILDLEKQIEEGAEDIIQLKRTRNSLLNISARVPPEILSHIFRWNVALYGDFEGLQEGSYNFLLVCCYWFEVASRTPELWSFWGEDLYQWSRRYQRSGAITPLDLVLTTCSGHDPADLISFDGPLRDALNYRVASDSIRSIHLRDTGTSPTLPSVISSLIHSDKEIRCSSIKSVIIDSPTLDVSGLLTRYHFPKLRRLRLMAINYSIWNQLGSNGATPSLTSLSILGGDPSAPPTTSQLCSVLVSNPQLQSLCLARSSIPRDNGGRYEFTVRLPHLKNLELGGEPRSVFQLLHQLALPETMDSVRLNLFRCTAEDVSRPIGPYIQDFLHHDRFKSRLGIVAYILPSRVSIAAIVMDNSTSLETLSLAKRPQFHVLLEENDGPLDEILVNLTPHVPGGEVIFSKGGPDSSHIKKTITTMPNIQELDLIRMAPGWFEQPGPYGPLATMKQRVYGTCTVIAFFTLVFSASLSGWLGDYS